MSSRSRWRSRSRSADLTLVSDRAVSQIGAGRSMLVNLVPEFLAVLAAPDPAAAYSEYLDRHGPVLTSYWQNYVLDPASPHAEQVIAAALRADRSDLKRLLEDVDVVSISEDALQRVLERFAAAVPPDSGARRVPAARDGSHARRDRAGLAVALSDRRADASRQTDGREGAAGARRVLPRPAPGRELPRRAGYRLDVARRGRRVPSGGRPGARDSDRVSPRPKAERRTNRPLREVLDELLVHAREIARRSKEMTPAELDYAQQRLEWLADEVWHNATGERPSE